VAETHRAGRRHRFRLQPAHPVPLETSGHPTIRRSAGPTGARRTARAVPRLGPASRWQTPDPGSRAPDSNFMSKNNPGGPAPAGPPGSGPVAPLPVPPLREQPSTARHQLIPNIYTILKTATTVFTFFSARAAGVRSLKSSRLRPPCPQLVAVPYGGMSRPKPGRFAGGAAFGPPHPLGG